MSFDIRFFLSPIFFGLTAQVIPLRSGLRVFCFIGSALNNTGFPPIKQTLACDSKPPRSPSCPNNITKGTHVLVEGSLISSTYNEQANGKGKKAKTAKITSWSIRADVVRKLDRSEPKPETVASGSATSSEGFDASDPAPF